MQLGRGDRITRSQTHSAAAQAVLNTTELLENILVHLPNQTIITSMRVCHQFQATIQKSIMIQERLFLRIHGKGTETWKYLEHVGPLGTFARTKEAPSVQPHDENSHNYVHGISNFIATSSHNPLLTIRSPFARLHQRVLLAGRHLEAALHLTLRGYPVPTMLYDMQLTDSPTLWVLAYVTWSDSQNYSGVASIQMRDPNGCTIGKILEALRVKILQQYKDNPKSIRVDSSLLMIDPLGMLLPDDKDRESCLALVSGPGEP